jgi:hypothetical protein
MCIRWRRVQARLHYLKSIKKLSPDAECPGPHSGLADCLDPLVREALKNEDVMMRTSFRWYLRIRVLLSLCAGECYCVSTSDVRVRVGL